jgi:hypothetical protein
VNKKGLFHNPEKWLDYLKQGMVLNATTIQTVGGTSSRQPVYYHPEAWEKYRKETANLVTTPTRRGTVRQPLLYHPEDWKRFSATSVNKKPRRANTRARVPVMTNRNTPPVKKLYDKQPQRLGTLPAAGRKLQFKPVIAE